MSTPPDAPQGVEEEREGTSPRAPTHEGAPNPYALPLTDTRLRALQEGLGAFGLHRIIGLFCGVASVPRRIPDALWLGEVLDEVPFPDEAAFREVADVLLPLCEHIKQRLSESDIAQLVPHADDEAACAAWARGYASVLRHVDPAQLPSELVQASFSIQTLAEVPSMLAVLDNLRGETPRADVLATHRAGLADDAARLLEGWADEPKVAFTTTLRRDAPKVGRNDPCPCGSGKKAKKCCQR